jgi:hypothetical protein
MGQSGMLCHLDFDCSRIFETSSLECSACSEAAAIQQTPGLECAPQTAVAPAAEVQRLRSWNQTRSGTYSPWVGDTAVSDHRRSRLVDR